MDDDGAGNHQKVAGAEGQTREKPTQWVYDGFAAAVAASTGGRCWHLVYFFPSNFEVFSLKLKPRKFLFVLFF
jgi:hypothetical protein